MKYKKFGIRISSEVLENIDVIGRERGIVFKSGSRKNTTNRNKTIAALLQEAIDKHAHMMLWGQEDECP